MNILCPLYVTNSWTNSWMWDNQLQPHKLKYHQLIQYDKKEFSYDDIENTDINVHYDGYRSCYRIDIKLRYDVHNFWIFSEKEWIYVSKYVKEIIGHQYESMCKLTSLVGLSNGAYMEKEPLKMYKYINIKLRREKLDKINKL